jgi:hypothetical protein
VGAIFLGPGYSLKRFEKQLLGDNFVYYNGIISPGYSKSKNWNDV